MLGSRPSKFEHSSLEIEWVELSGSLVDIQEGWSAAPRPSLPLFPLVLCVCVCAWQVSQEADTHRTTQFFLRKLNKEILNCTYVCVLIYYSDSHSENNGIILGEVQYSPLLFNL